MDTVTVRNKEDLKNALSSNATEIIVDDGKLVKQLRAIKLLRKAGPIAIGAVVAAIPLVPITGGASLPATIVGFVGVSGFGASASILGLTIAIGGIYVIGVFTNWEEVELAGVFKLKRKSK